MAWTSLTSARLGDLIRFLGPREAHCTAFTEKLLNNGRAVIPDGNEHRVLVRVDPAGRIDGAILQSKSGLYYPVLSDSSCQVEQSAVDLLFGDGSQERCRCDGGSSPDAAYPGG